MEKLLTRPNEGRKHSRECTAGKRATGTAGHADESLNRKRNRACIPGLVFSCRNYLLSVFKCWCMGGTTSCTHALPESFIHSRGFSMSVHIHLCSITATLALLRRLDALARSSK